jgi:hypothetical protein
MPSCCPCERVSEPRGASQTDWNPTARADPQDFLAVPERIQQTAGPVVAGNEP